MEDKRLKYLLDKYQADTLSVEEQTELNDWYHNLNFKDEQFDPLVADKEFLFSDFKARLQTTSRVSVLHRISTYIAAAVIVFIISAGLWFMKKEPQPELVKAVPKKELIKPGGNKAFLTLADGSRISLTDAPDGAIATQAGIQVTKTKDGQLVYKVLASADAHTENVKFNTIHTPRGGQYQVMLPDGSRVWLNAASSLKYPTHFTGAERRVELEGEGYFEIAQNKLMPFRVVSNDQVVEVLGTHFNVNAYSDEKSMVTTLLEGSVKVNTARGKTQLMKPGQQNELYANGDMKLSAVNTELAVAWKDGKFIFRNEELESVMRKIARWYDVEIEYEKGVPQKTVWGNVSRFDDVSDILELIELSKVAKFKFKGRRIIVMR
ncbi:MAG: FecR domain-containing protein [Bacteroidota bacterium]